MGYSIYISEKSRFANFFNKVRFLISSGICMALIKSSIPRVFSRHLFAQGLRGFSYTDISFFLCEWRILIYIETSVNLWSLGLLCQHDNVKPHTVVVTRNFMQITRMLTSWSGQSDQLAPISPKRHRMTLGEVFANIDPQGCCECKSGAGDVSRYPWTFAHQPKLYSKRLLSLCQIHAEFTYNLL